MYSMATTISITVIGCLFLFVGTHGNNNAVESDLPSLNEFTNAVLHAHSIRNKRDNSQTELKIGDCSMDKYQYNVMVCSSLLYKPKMTCRNQMPKYLDCVKAIIRSCLTDPVMINITESTLEKTLQKLNFTQTACDNGGYMDILPPQTVALCNGEIQSDYTSCVTNFIKMFRNDHTDNRLCAESIKTTDCTTKAMVTHCKGEAIQIALNSAKKLSSESGGPFCSFKEGAPNPADILSGKLLNPQTPKSGANILAFSTVTSLIMLVISLIYLY